MVLKITIYPKSDQPAVMPGEPAPPPDEGAIVDPWAAIAEERAIESGLVERVRSHKRKVAEEFLDTIAPPEQKPKPPVVPIPPGPPPKTPVAPPADEQARQEAALPRREETPVGPPPVAKPSEPATPATYRGPATPVAVAAAPSDVSGAITDVGRGVTEIPRQVVGGMRDAAQSAIGLADWLVDHSPTAMIQAGITTAMEGAPPPKRKPLQLPEVKAATTVTGGAVRGVSQFLTGFVTAGGVIGGVATVGRGLLAGALADFTAFDAHEQRLANLIEQVPALKNPVTEFMAAKPGEHEIEGRFKRALEGLGLGALTMGMIHGVKYVRDAKRAAAALQPEAAATRAEQPAVSPLGPSDAPAVSAPTKEAAATKPAPGAPLSQDRPKIEGALEPGGPEEQAAALLTLRAKGLIPISEGEHPVFVNFARIETSEDIKRVIADTTAAFSGDIEAARRGVRSNKVTLDAAGAEDAWKALTERRVGAPLNAEQSVAARQLWEGSATKLFEMAEKAATEPTPENLFAFRKMMAIHHEIQTQVIAARTETARALQSWSIPVGAEGAARLRAIDSILGTYGGPEATQVLAEQVMKLKNQPYRAGMLGDLSRSAFARSTDAVKEYMVNALLSGPKTHIVNILGNTIGVAQEMVERAAAGLVSQAVGSGQVQVGEAVAKFVGQRQGIREGWQLFTKALETGQSQFGMQTKLADLGFANRGFVKAITADHLQLDPASFIGKAVDALGTVVNMPVRFLVAEDDFFKAVGYRMEVNAQAFRQASREVSDGLPRDLMNARFAELAANPPEHIHIAATDMAAYQTFNNQPGIMVSQINRADRGLMASPYAGAQLGSLALRMMIPFRNTPANLFNYALERSPVAPLMTRWRDAVARGGADADIAVTRMGLGTMALLGMMDYALDGTITGAGPKGKDKLPELQALQRSGWQPYSVKFGDRYFSYSRLDPLGISLTAAADLAEVMNNSTIDQDKAEGIFKVSAVAALTFGNSMLNKSYMQSVGELFSGFDEPGKGPRFFQRRLAMFEPALLAQTRQVVDPYLRYTADLSAELRNRTPGLSEDLPAARDLWGRPRKYSSGLGLVYDAISPIASKVSNPEPIDAAAIKQGWKLAMPSKSLLYSAGVSVSLQNRPEVFSRFLELAGQTKPSAIGSGDNVKLLLKKYGDFTMTDLLNDIVKGEHPLSEQYQAAGDGPGGGKYKLVRKIVSDYQRAAKWQIAEEFPAVESVRDKKELEREMME